VSLRCGITALAALAACGRGAEAPAPPRVAAPPPVDAAPAALPDAVPPFDPESLPSWGDDATGEVAVHAADVDGATLRSLLRGAPYVIAARPPVLVSGRVRSADEAAARDALIAAHPDLAVAPLNPKGKGKAVTTAASAYQAEPFFANLAYELGLNVVLPAEGAASLDVAVRDTTGEAVLAAAVAALGLVADRHGNTWYLRRPDARRLDAGLVRRGPREVDVELLGARPGEIYALLAALGAGIGGAACDDDAPTVSLRFTRAPAGVIAAVVAERTGAKPTRRTRCKPGRAPADLAGLEIVAWGAAGKKRAVVARTATGPVLIDGARARAMFRDRSAPVAVETDAQTGATAGPPGADEYLAGARLAATVVGPDRKLAIVELSYAGWTTFGENGDHSWLGIDSLTIEPGRLVWRDVAGEHVLALQPRP
jgi:hypothetical protein